MKFKVSPVFVFPAPAGEPLRNPIDIHATASTREEAIAAAETAGYRVVIDGGLVERAVDQRWDNAECRQVEYEYWAVTVEPETK